MLLSFSTWQPAHAQNAAAGIGLKLANVYLSGDQVDFDIVVYALSPQKIYLSFSDIVLRFEPNRLSDTARLRLWPGSSQLLSSEQQRVSLYEMRYILRIEQRNGFDYVYIGIDPPRFRDLQQFVAVVAQLDQRESLYRLGRFSLTGVKQLPDNLNFFQIDKGIKTQVFHFLPKEDFRAELTAMSCTGVNIMEQEIEYFEAERQENKVQLRWKQGETAAWQTLSIERSYDLLKWDEVAFTPTGITALQDEPRPPKSLEGTTLVYYRLNVKTNTGQNFFSSIRLLEF